MAKGKDMAVTMYETRGLMLVLSSPSGAGKTTIANEIKKSDPNVRMSVSVTTREPRPGERDGVDYFFVSKEEFKRRREQKLFIEWASVFSFHYATPRDYVETRLADGKDVLFDIDWQGTQQLVDECPKDVVSIFIMPPSRATLRKRLTNRSQDSGETIDARMAEASREMSHWPEYDYVVVNDVVEDTMQGVRAILAAERLRRERQVGLHSMVRAMAEEM